MPYALFGLALGLRFVLNNFGKNLTKKIPKIEFVPFLLLAVATTALASTALGAWLSGMLSTVIGWGCDLIGQIPNLPTPSVTMVASVVFVLVALAAIGDLADGEPDGIAKTAVIVLPFLLLAATGPLAEGATGLFDTLVTIGGDTIMGLIGR